MNNAKVGFLGAVALTLAIFPLASAQSAKPRPLPKGAYAKNVEFVSFTDVNGHIPFKMSIQQANGRWYMYAAAQNDRGWSVLDITNPANPTFLNWIPGPENTRTVQVDIADGKMITGLERSQSGGDTDPAKPWDDGVLIWSLADPVHPELLGHYHTGGLGTHRNGYYGGRYMYLSAGANGYSGNIFEIVDISDPAHAFEVSRWALPELKLADPNALNTAWPHGHGLHGPPVIVDNLAYLGFDNKMVILDISDVHNPKEVSELTFDPPYHLLFAVHTVLPFPTPEDCRDQLRRGLRGWTQPGFLNRCRGPGQTQDFVVFPRSGATPRRAVQGFLREKRRLRRAQRQHAVPQSQCGSFGQHHLHDVYQCGFAGV